MMFVWEDINVKMKIKILVPIYNDWQSVSKLLDEIDYNISDLDHEISVIIVNDASTHDRQRSKRILQIFTQ